MQMGVGVGWNDPEYTALDMDFTNRGRRMEEQIEVMRKLWTEEHVTFSGTWHMIDDAGLAPMPVQRPIPIWIGALGDTAIERAARMGEGWQCLLGAPNDDVRAAFEKFGEDAQAAGRNPDDVGIEAPLFTSEHDVDAWGDLIEQWKAVGATQLVFRPQGDFATILELTKAFGEALL